jgi:phosphoribosylformimino-5-aminoimidazole carboxamide ribotide isomerase
MEIYPAIDLIGGRCVRLSEGDFNARTNYAAEPQDVATSYAAAGAKWFHVVDLDGAKDPAKRQKDTIAALAQSPLKMQTGGGVRSAADVEALLALGASRVIIGSLCVKEPTMVMKILVIFPAGSLSPRPAGRRHPAYGWKSFSASTAARHSIFSALTYRRTAK